MNHSGHIIAGKYELEEVAGSGGMATVWRAMQRGAAGFRRPVCIKRIRPELAHDEHFVELFVEEARVCSQLVHPNVVQIYDFGQDDGLYYLVMEWVDGLSLSRFAQAMHEQRVLPSWPLVAAVAIEALKGLGAAHDRCDEHGTPTPIYHRDVSPQNILLGSNGVVKLTDFGLARATDRARMTAPEIIKGKVGYLAPELTQAKSPSPQSDIYALGVVLWQALAGRKLFAGSNDIDTFVAASRGEVPPLGEARPDVPRAFASIIERALALDPEDRFRSAEQMGRVIAKLLRSADAHPDARFIATHVSDVRQYLSNGEPHC